MRSVRLVGLSDDGRSLVLALDDGDERLTLPVDDRLRAAARGDARRLGQIDVGLGNDLPPRVIQARIRSGRTPEQVAAESGTSVERIMRFAHPVLQERARVAEQARSARVRLSESTPTVALEQFMSDRLRLLGTDVDDVTWDAYRSDDGSWQVTGAWRAGESAGTACWTLDVQARTVTPSDAATMDFAEGTRLVRVVPDVPHGPGPAGRGMSVLREASEPAAPTGPDSDDPAEHDAGAGTAPGDTAPDAAAPRPPADPYDPAYLDELAEHDTVVLGRGGQEPDDDDPRVRIPAWEDIVFGVRRHR
ncbi:septation protein SepH [Geodermatophilus sp. YIM 151500]|uniref:septation protein SepH n=1 Tax=Geodermatophilus sp. YIM 151500 TaxID=2984531 RepID=UPI0021E4F5E3|nr:septation protein SepH [Geodermatophilus sp. YIM 151500]MCV2489637.1 septation protein SepH [Geodermatophilus sp. YIM 151500]